MKILKLFLIELQNTILKQLQRYKERNPLEYLYLSLKEKESWSLIAECKKCVMERVIHKLISHSNRGAVDGGGGMQAKKNCPTSEQSIVLEKCYDGMYKFLENQVYGNFSGSNGNLHPI